MKINKFILKKKQITHPYFIKKLTIPLDDRENLRNRAGRSLHDWYIIKKPPTIDGREEQPAWVLLYILKRKC